LDASTVGERSVRVVACIDLAQQIKWRVALVLLSTESFDSITQRKEIGDHTFPLSILFFYPIFPCCKVDCPNFLHTVYIGSKTDQGQRGREMNLVDPGLVKERERDFDFHLTSVPGLSPTFHIGE
jgi:hypothetical protein